MHLDDSSQTSIPLDLPVKDESVLASERRETPDPEYTRAEQRLRHGMIEEQGGLTLQRPRVEGVVHYHNDIYVVRLGLIRHKRPKDDEACEVTSSTRQIVDSTEPLGDPFSRSGSATESKFHFVQCRSMDSSGKSPDFPKLGIGTTNSIASSLGQSFVWPFEGRTVDRLSVAPYAQVSQIPIVPSYTRIR